MLFNSVFVAFLTASAAVAAAVAAEPEQFNPTGNPLPTPVYEDIVQPLTNAERLRRGMAPLPPKMKRFGLHAPGPVQAPAPEPSAAPPQPSDGPSPDPDVVFNGYVQVSDAKTDEVLGYVSTTLTRFGQLGVDANKKKPLEVTFSTTRANQKPRSVKITNGDGRSGTFLGAVASQWMSGGFMGKGKNMFAYLARTGETRWGHGPMNIANSILAFMGMRLKAQSAIWTANPLTGELKSVWANTGGQSYDTTVFYYKSMDALAITFDSNSFKGAHSDAVAVKLTIVPVDV